MWPRLDKIWSGLGDSSDATVEYLESMRSFVTLNELPVVLTQNPSVYISRKPDRPLADQARDIHRAVRKFGIGKTMSNWKAVKTGAINSVVLLPDEKAEIHSLINNIREIVEQSNLKKEKKNAIFTKLNSLEAEVDRVGTRMDAFFGLFVDAALALGQGAENAKPFLDEVRKIIEAIMKAKAREEGTSLPGPVERILLDKPKTDSPDDESS